MNDFLDQIVVKWQDARKAYLDRCLEVGGMMVDYLLVEMNKRTFEGRHTCRIYRGQLIDEAAKRIDVERRHLNEFMARNRAVFLLSEDGERGSLATESLRAFARLIRRKDATEEWSIIGDAEKAKGLFRQAVMEKWDAFKTRMELNKVRGRTAFRSANKYRSHKKSNYKVFGEEERAQKVVSVCCPGDAAELLCQQILANDDPMQVVEHLMGLLESADFLAQVKQKKKQRKKSA